MDPIINREVLDICHHYGIDPHTMEQPAIRRATFNNADAQIDIPDSIPTERIIGEYGDSLIIRTLPHIERLLMAYEARDRLLRNRPNRPRL